MKKIIIVNTSPRPKGNCAAITARLQEDLADAEVKTVDFKNAEINYCKGCDACKKKDTVWCVQKDDMSALLPEIDACDGLVLLTPIYWGDFSAQAKTFIDRLYAFFHPALETMTVATKFGKKIAIVETCGGGPADVYAEKAQAVADGGLKVAGFTESEVLAFGGVNEPGSVAAIDDDMSQVDDLAAWLIA